MIAGVLVLSPARETATVAEFATVSTAVDALICSQKKRRVFLRRLRCTDVVSRYGRGSRRDPDCVTVLRRRVSSPHPWDLFCETCRVHNFELAPRVTREDTIYASAYVDSTAFERSSIEEILRLGRSV